MGWLKNLAAKVIGKRIAKKMDLKEGAMEDSKKWWKSKTIWGGVYVALKAAYEALRASVLPQLPEVPAFVDSLVGGIVGGSIIYGRVTATKAISS